MDVDGDDQDRAERTEDGATARRRDRDADGRPEQARPRDRTGRPLPYGTTGVPTTEEHDPDSVEAALEIGARLWNEQRYFEAHECLESVWHAAPEDDRDLWQGIIQVAVAGVHVQRGNPVGALALFRRAAGRLQRYPDVHRGLQVASVRAHAEAAADRVERDGVDGIELPAFPAAPDGAWFTVDPAALEPSVTPTPLPDGPAWLDASRRRAERDDGDATT